MWRVLWRVCAFLRRGRLPLDFASHECADVAHGDVLGAFETGKFCLCDAFKGLACKFCREPDMTLHALKCLFTSSVFVREHASHDAADEAIRHTRKEWSVYWLTHVFSPKPFTLEGVFVSGDDRGFAVDDFNIVTKERCLCDSACHAT